VATSPNGNKDSGEFVFGQNLAERVVQSSSASPDETEAKDKDSSDDEAESGKCIGTRVFITIR
jgi:hypothetical protein